MRTSGKISGSTGFTCIVMLLTINPLLGENNCTISIENRLQIANCSHLGWTEVPPTLSSLIKVLVLSYNEIHCLLYKSFVRYSHLLELYLNGNSLHSIQAETFLPLIHLRILDMSDIQHHHPFDHYWPVKIRKLLISNNLITCNLTLVELKHLEMLHADNCSLQGFPQVTTDFSYLHMNLKLNPLNNLALEDLLHLSHLDQLDLEWPEHSSINSSREWCTCIKMKHLLNKRNVKAPELNCSKSDVESIFCDALLITIPDNVFEYGVQEKVFCTSIIEILIPLIITMITVFVFVVYMIYKALKRYFDEGSGRINLEEESPL